MKIFGKNGEQFHMEVPTAVTVGNFDGVHLGHKSLLSDLTRLSEENGLCSVIYTFKDHPLNALKGAESVVSIVNMEAKQELFETNGVDVLYLEDFFNVKDLEPERFVKEILVDKFRMKLAVMGENNRFGKNGAGDWKLLKSLGEVYGFSVHVTKDVVVENTLCSSSKIRERLKNGDVQGANSLLGRSFSIKSIVTTGKRLGRTYGFPTVNLEISPGMLLPADGVYATETVYKGKTYASITNVGQTSFDKIKMRNIETHILGFDSDVYGEEVEIKFLDKMRDFIPFLNLGDLRKQLEEDKKERMKYTEGQL